MAFTVVLHLPGDTPVTGELDELPKPTDTNLVLNNPRSRDGKDLHYLGANVVKVVWPLANITFIEVLESEEDEKIIGFVRE
jgi:hypothetical protein